MDAGRAPQWPGRLIAAALVISALVWVVLVVAFIRDEWARQARIDAGTQACCPPEDLGLIATIVTTLSVTALGLAVLAVVRCRAWSWSLALLYVVVLTPLAVIATGMGLDPNGLDTSALAGWAMTVSGGLNGLAAVMALGLALLAGLRPIRRRPGIGASTVV